MIDDDDDGARRRNEQAADLPMSTRTVGKSRSGGHRSDKVASVSSRSKTLKLIVSLGRSRVLIPCRSLPFLHCVIRPDVQPKTLDNSVYICCADRLRRELERKRHEKKHLEPNCPFGPTEIDPLVSCRKENAFLAGCSCTLLQQPVRWHLLCCYWAGPKLRFLNP